MVHPLPKFMNLPLNDIGNEAPIDLVERIQGTKKQIPSLRLCPQGHTFLCSTTSTNQSFGGIFVLLAALLCLSAYCPSHMSEMMSSIVSMEGKKIHGLSALGGSTWHFKTAAMSATGTSTSLSSIEETRMSGRSQSYFKFS